MADRLFYHSPPASLAGLTDRTVTWTLTSGSDGVTVGSDGTLSGATVRENFAEGQDALPWSKWLAVTATDGDTGETKDFELVIFSGAGETQQLFGFDYDLSAIPLASCAAILRDAWQRYVSYVGEYRNAVLGVRATNKLPRTLLAMEQCGVTEMLRPYLRLGVGGL